MTRTSAKDLSAMMGTGRRTDFSPRRTRQIGGLSDVDTPAKASDSSSPYSSAQGTQEGHRYFTARGSPSSSTQRSPSRQWDNPTSGSKSYVPSRLRAASRVAFREMSTPGSPYTPSGLRLQQGIGHLEPRYTVPIPMNSTARAAVTSASPPVLPSAFRTQQSLWHFVEGESVQGSPNTVLPERLFNSPGKPRHSGGTYMTGKTTGKKTKSSFEKLVEKTCARCSHCGALGHRFHLAGCRFGSMGSIV